MGILDFFRRNKSEVIEDAQEEVTREEIKIAKDALKLFQEAMQDNSDAVSHFDRGKQHSAAGLFEQTCRKLLEIRNFSRDIISLAKRLISALAEKRDGNQDNPEEFLSRNELTIITFGKDIKARIKEIVDKIEGLESVLKDSRFYGIDRFELDNVYDKIAELTKKLEELYKLEEQIYSKQASHVIAA